MFKRFFWYSTTLMIGLILLVNFLRFYILINGYNRIGRMPRFTDGNEYIKKVLFHWRIDEFILLFGHFMLLLIIPMLGIAVYHLSGKKWVVGIFFGLLMIIEVRLRYSTGYSYIMFD